MYFIDNNSCTIIKTVEVKNKTLRIATATYNLYFDFETKKDAINVFNYILKCLKLTHMVSMKHIKNEYPEIKIIQC